MDYKYNKMAGALNEAAPAPHKKRVSSSARGLGMGSSNSSPRNEMAEQDAPADDYASAHNTGVFSLAELQQAVGAPPAEFSQMGPASAAAADRVMRRREAPKTTGSGVDPFAHRREFGMFFYTVRDGEKIRVIYSSGKTELVTGPAKLWRWGKSIETMTHYVAHPGEFLIVRYRDGRQEHHSGPAHVWLDPTEHLSVDKEDALPIAMKEAIVVYSRSAETGEVARRIVHGPATFVPSPGEWLHTFSWHGSKGGQFGYEKVPNALVFQKLWFLPDQMYHDIPDVRTADDAVLTIRLMLFFELVDLPRMLETTHDPIGDFVNAATSDVVDFTGRYTLEEFKRHTDRLNDQTTYVQLMARAEQCGYRINKVVYRGYGAPESLQRMHDEAIESRTRLQLERATQQQAQDLEDFKLERDLARGARHRTEQESLVIHEIAQAERRRAAEIDDQRTRRDFAREQAQRDADQRAAERQRADGAHLAHLGSMRQLGVDLTAFLTQGRADRVIEVRGGESTHLHLEPNRRGENS